MASFQLFYLRDGALVRVLQKGFGGRDSILPYSKYIALPDYRLGLRLKETPTSPMPRSDYFSRNGSNQAQASLGSPKK
jgi:hypothetical protein